MYIYSCIYPHTYTFIFCLLCVACSFPLWQQQGWNVEKASPLSEVLQRQKEEEDAYNQKEAWLDNMEAPHSTTKGSSEDKLSTHAQTGQNDTTWSNMILHNH